MLVRAALAELFALLWLALQKRSHAGRLVRFLPERGGHVLPQLRDDLLLAHLLDDAAALVGAARRDDRAGVRGDVYAAGAGLRRRRRVVTVALPLVVLGFIFV